MCAGVSCAVVGAALRLALPFPCLRPFLLLITRAVNQVTVLATLARPCKDRSGPPENKSVMTENKKYCHCLHTSLSLRDGLALLWSQGRGQRGRTGGGEWGGGRQERQVIRTQPRGRTTVHHRPYTQRDETQMGLRERVREGEGRGKGGGETSFHRVFSKSMKDGLCRNRERI